MIRQLLKLIILLLDFVPLIADDKCHTFTYVNMYFRVGNINIISKYSFQSDVAGCGLMWVYSFMWELPR